MESPSSSPDTAAPTVPLRVLNASVAVVKILEYSRKELAFGAAVRTTSPFSSAKYCSPGSVRVFT